MCGPVWIPKVVSLVCGDRAHANGPPEHDAYRRLSRNRLRIAIFPAVDPEDVAQLTRCVDHVVGALSA